MKLKIKKAFTLAEILLAGTVLVIVMAMVVPHLNRIMPDAEVIRFKKVYTGIVSVISAMTGDAKVYPDFRGFADTGLGIDSLGDKYLGETKFAEFFISKLNVIDDNLNLKIDGSTVFPYGISYGVTTETKKYKYGSTTKTGTYRKITEGIKTASSNDFLCVKVNTGEIICLPPKVSDVLDENNPNSDNSIFIRIYMQDKDFTEKKAFYIAVRANGKVSLPTVGADFNCKEAGADGRMNEKARNFNQCKVVSKLDSV